MLNFRSTKRKSKNNERFVNLIMCHFIMCAIERLPWYEVDLHSDFGAVAFSEGFVI